MVVEYTCPADPGAVLIEWITADDHWFECPSCAVRYRPGDAS